MLTFRSLLPNLLRELVEGHPSPGPMVRAVNLTMPLIHKLAQRASELNDPKLNVIMLELALYDVPPEQIPAEIEKQKSLSC